jgi:pimeloyl-ACP methyl ester carboxylesterase
VPTTTIDGIATHFEVSGDGPPLPLFSPGGFNATMENWRSLSVYARLGLLGPLSSRFTCIAFDRRESGESGGRVERLDWRRYARQGRGLLEHLGIDRAHVMGGCAGCSVAIAFAATYPAATNGIVCFWPAGGVKYRLGQHARLGQHLGYAAEHGLGGVVELARATDEPFTRDARVGPWAPVIRRDKAFAEAYARQEPDRYAAVVAGTARLLFDRDTVPGAEPEDLLLLDTPALVIPGQDDSHATSAGRYLGECLRHAQYWDVPVGEQTDITVPARILDFLGGA